MPTLTTVAELRAELDRARLNGHQIGLVPTMGALHAGHLSLIDRSVAENDLTVVTIFVNPAQFGPNEDLDAYPRQLAQDEAAAVERGADIVFAPSQDEVYPAGHATTVIVGGVSETLCGDAKRRGRAHFDGVATVVTKLFNMVEADRAYFGQKDAQQVAVIRRLATDLNVRTQVIACPTVREADGLALSSRNSYLSAAERQRALALATSLRAAQNALREGERSADRLAAVAREQLLDVDELEYFEIVDPTTLEPVADVDGAALALVAARVGTTRLIDNELITARMADGSQSQTQHDPQGSTL